MFKRLFAVLLVFLVAAVGVSAVLQMPPGSAQAVTLRGRVLDSAGSPLAGAAVSAGGVAATTGSDGSWVITLDSATITVTANKAGYSPGAIQVPASGGSSVFFSLTASPAQPGLATLRGKVAAPDGSPVAAATVSAGGRSTVTGLDGRWEITVPPGTHAVRATKDGSEAVSPPVAATGEKAYTVDLTLPQAPAPKPSAVILKVVTTHDDAVTARAEATFLQSSYAKRHNVVDVNWIRPGGEAWAAAIRRSGADAAWGGTPQIFFVLYGEGLLDVFIGDTEATPPLGIPERLGGALMKWVRKGDTYWCAASVSGFAITVDRQKLTELKLKEPAGWRDLANETYAAAVTAIGDPTPTLNTRLIEGVIQAYGWKEGWGILTRMGANAVILPDERDARDAAVQGRAAVGVTTISDGLSARLLSQWRCDYSVPRDGTLPYAEPIAVLETSRSRDAAQAFVAWALSVEGQKLWLSPGVSGLPANPAVLDTPEGRARPDVKVALAALKDAAVPGYNENPFAFISNSLSAYYSGTVVKPHEKLRDTWVSLTQAYAAGGITRTQFRLLAGRLGDPSELKFTWETANTLNGQIESAASRAKAEEEFYRAALARYDAVAAELKALTG